MRVVVTGGAGRVARSAVALFVERGHEVTVVDTAAAPAREPTAPDVAAGPAWVTADVRDFDSLAATFRGADAVVHLAAIATAVGRPGRDVFDSNVRGTFTVFDAAAAASVGRVVVASSINAVGNQYGVRAAPVHYLPIDEEHPTFTSDAYSFAKLICEEVGRYAWRRHGIPSLLLRFPAVHRHERVLSEQATDGRQRRTAIDELLALPERAREARLLRLGAIHDEMRKRHPSERAAGRWLRDELAAAGVSPAEHDFLIQRGDFFAYVDELDSAAAILAAATASADGSRPLFVNASRNWPGITREEARSLFVPAPPLRQAGREADTTLVSIDLAREVIGFEPVWAV